MRQGWQPHAVVLDDGIRCSRVDQAPTTGIVQSIEHRHFQIFDVAPNLMMAETDRLITVGLQFIYQQFVDPGTGLCPGTHLVHLHAHGPGGDTAEKRVVLY